jgi:hypothetical protein
LKIVVKNINQTIHDSTGFTPEFLQFGMDSQNNNSVPLAEARKQACDRSRAQQQVTQVKHLEKSSPSNFQVGDAVRHRLPHNHPELGNKLNPRWWAPCLVIEKLGKETFRLRHININDNSVIREFTSHSALLAPYIWRSDPNPDSTSDPNSDFTSDPNPNSNSDPNFDSTSDSISDSTPDPNSNSSSDSSSTEQNNDNHQEK